MRLYKTYIVIICFFIWNISTVSAQKDFVAAGGDAAGYGGSVSYSIGQIYYMSLYGNGGEMTQGIQQPYEIFVVSGESQRGISLSFSVYPLPATDFVYLKVEKGEIENLSYGLHDVIGRLIAKEKVVDLETRIPLQGLKDKLFFVRVYKNNLEIKCFKVISAN